MELSGQTINHTIREIRIDRFVVSLQFFDHTLDLHDHPGSVLVRGMRYRRMSGCTQVSAVIDGSLSSSKNLKREWMMEKVWLGLFGFQAFSGDQKGPQRLHIASTPLATSQCACPSKTFIPKTKNWIFFLQTSGAYVLTVHPSSEKKLESNCCSIRAMVDRPLMKMSMIEAADVKY